MPIIARNFQSFHPSMLENKGKPQSYGCVGLDVGSGGVKTVVTVVRPDRSVLDCRLLTNGHTSIASAICFPPDEPPLIGVEAQNCALLGQGSISGIGKDGLVDPHALYALGDDEHEYSAVETLSAFLKEAFARLEKELVQPLSSLPTGISYPANFPAHQRETLVELLKKQGVNLVVEGEEPVQALLSFLPFLKGSSVKPELRIVVMDLGGGTTDLVALRYNPEGQAVALQSTMHVPVAGIDFDNLLVDIIRNKCFGGRDLHDPVLLSEMKIQAQCSKHELSDRDDAQVILSAREWAECTILRSEFEAGMEELLQHIRRAMQQAAQESGMAPASIDTVIVTGGTGHIPAVQRLIGSFYPQAEILMSSDCEFDVALGNARAALQAMAKRNLPAGLLPALPAYTVRNVLSYNLCIKVYGQVGFFSPRLINHLLIPRNTPIPTQKKIDHFRPHQPHQTQATIVLTAAEPESDFEERNVIAQETLPLAPQSDNHRGQVEVSAEVTETGRARIHARDCFGSGSVDFETDLPIQPQSES